MPIKQFHPAIDGLALSHDWSLKHPQGKQVREILDSALADAIYYLRHSYKGALEAYGIQAWLKAWVELGLPNHSLTDSGVLYAILDHYYARRSPPKPFQETTSKRALAFRAYLVRRILDSRRANAVEQLKAVAISNLMPDSWVQESAVVDHIKREISSLGTYLKPEVELDLHIPRSGKHWIQHKTAKEWEKLKSYLDKCEPRPITCVVTAGSGFRVDRTRIAYGYEIIEQRVVEIFTFDFNDHAMNDPVRIHLEPSGSRHQLHSEIEGFYLEKYEPVPVPLSLWVQIIHLIVPSTLIWYIKRLIWFMIQETGSHRSHGAAGTQSQ